MWLPSLSGCAQQGAVGVQGCVATNGDQYSARWTTCRDKTMFPTGCRAQTSELENKMITQKDELRVEVLFIASRGYSH